MPREFAVMLDHPLVTQFLREIRTLYEMLSSVSKYPATPDFEDERVEGAMTLVNYLRRTHRTDIYMKYVHFLHQLHRKLGNKAEAALSYVLYADILDWSAEYQSPFFVESQGVFGAQTSAARLEEVLIRSVDDLVAANCWEEALRLLGVLLQRYGHVTSELTKATAVLRRAAVLSDAIAHQERVYPSYFFVKFAGDGCPAAFRNDVFVYRGTLGERLADFEARIMQKWHGAKKIPLKIDTVTTSTAAGTAREGDSARKPLPLPDKPAPTGPVFEIAMAGAATEPYIPVHPIYDPQPWISPATAAENAYADADMQGSAMRDWVALATAARPGLGLSDAVSWTPHKASLVIRDHDEGVRPKLVRKGKHNSGVRFFVHSRPFRKRAVKTSNEFLDSWASRCYVEIENPFPCTRRRSRVRATHEIVLNPIEVAVLTLEEKHDSLVDAIERAAAGPDRSAEQDFSQKLQGVVDAAVSGGIANYRTFFSGAFKATHPEIQEDIDADVTGQKARVFDALREALVKLLLVVARGIRVHSVKCSEALLPLHEFLCKRFDGMRQVLREMGVTLPLSGGGSDALAQGANSSRDSVIAGRAAVQGTGGAAGVAAAGVGASTGAATLQPQPQGVPT